MAGDGGRRGIENPSGSFSRVDITWARFDLETAEDVLAPQA
jgi:hypothetical protein